MTKLVFLHGSGVDKNAYFETMQNIASKFNAQLITFNAPFPHPNKKEKFVWFNKKEINGRRDAVEAEYFHSLQYVKECLATLKNDDEDIILIGHSQGGGLAVHVGLEMELKMVISICGDLPYNIFYINNSTTPIYWCEVEKMSILMLIVKRHSFFSRISEPIICIKFFRIVLIMNLLKI